MPRGFEVRGKNGRNKVLKLKEALYVLRHIPRSFWKYMTSKMELCGMVQSKMDPCLFIGEKVMAIIYVDKILFWSVEFSEIHDKAMKLREQGVDLEQEDDTADFLGVNLGYDETTGMMEIKQVGLIDHVIDTLGLDNGMAKVRFTPAESTPLLKDTSGEEACGSFINISVFGMLIYLSDHTCPDILYAVNCCARYIFCPKHSHGIALKRIGRYLKATRDRGLILNPNYDVCKLDCYPNADFLECMDMNYQLIQHV